GQPSLCRYIAFERLESGWGGRGGSSASCGIARASILYRHVVPATTWFIATAPAPTYFSFSQGRLRVSLAAAPANPERVVQKCSGIHPRLTTALRESRRQPPPCYRSSLPPLP